MNIRRIIGFAVALSTAIIYLHKYRTEYAIPSITNSFVRKSLFRLRLMELR